MANPAPTINQINAFNATQGTTIDFNIIGGTELVRSNRIYIYDLSDNSLICTHLYVSTESIHELPPNTDGSIVYESGKSSADFVNGAQYYAQIQTFTDIGGTEGGSGLSVAKMFWCLVDPTLTIDTIPSTISTTSYNVSATYNANTSVVSNIIQQYQFSLYSATGSLLQSSGVVVGNGEQQGTSTAYDISYNFTGLSVGSSYYVMVDVTTTQGMSVSTQSSTFTVSIDTPTLGEATVVNNACDGYISVTSNLSSEYGGSASGSIASFVTDSVNDVSSLKVTLNPIQDLHGYDKPWSGGAGKNKFSYPYTITSSGTINGVTYTVNGNGSITLTGTATGGADLALFSPNGYSLDSGTYKITLGGIKNGIKWVYGGSGGALTYNELTHTVADQTINMATSGTCGYCIIRIANGTETNTTLYPMIRFSSVTDATFEPYSNICPISGYDGVEVDVVGKNLFDGILQNGYWDTSNGTFVANNGWKATYKIKCKPNTTYVMSGTSYSSGSYNGNVVFWDSNGTYLGYRGTGANFTSYSDAEYMALYLGVSYITDSMQIEEGATATAYEPYTEQTVSEQFDVSLTPTSKDTDPYLFKAVGDIYGDRLTENIIGGTVAWNQLLQTLDTFSAESGVTKTYSDGVATITSTIARNGIYAPLNYQTGHKYLFVCDLKATSAYSVVLGAVSAAYINKTITGDNQWHTIAGISNSSTSGNKNAYIYATTTYENLQAKNYNVIDLTAMFGTTIADYIYSLEQATAGAGVAWFKKLFPKPYYAYNAGELMSVQASSHDMVGFNQWDEEWELGALSATGGNATSSTEIRSKNYIPVVGGQTYYLYCAVASTFNYKFYDADKNFISGAYIGRNNTLLIPNDARYMRFYMGAAYGTTYKNDICINLSLDGERNGEYEAYVKHSYALDSDLVLRGVPKLDNGNLYYDGDTYESDGTVTRKYGIVDLGTLNWSYNSSSLLFYTGINDAVKIANTGLHGVCSKYRCVVGYNPTGGINDTTQDKVFSIGSSFITVGNNLLIRDTAYTDPVAFKTAMSGVYLVYEKATPTTEQTDPFTQIQEVSKYGTLEYITTNDVPVGHNTTYLTRDVFGGTLDLVSGVLTVTHGAVDMGSLAWYLNGAITGGMQYAVSIADKKVGETNFICSAFETHTPSTKLGYICGRATTTTVACNATQTVLNDFKTAVTGQTICYELATPLTYQLTPQQIATLKGQNNVWSEQGDVEVTYNIPITNLLVKRQDVDDVSGDWLTLYSQPVSQASDMNFTFIDFLNQYGKTYKYALVPLLTQTQSGVEVEVEGGYTVSDEVQSIFDGVFIADQTGLQKCKANVGYGNVNMNQSVGSITPIGSQYPIIVTNSNNRYHNGSISGMIVPDDYYYNGNLSRIDMVNKRNELEQFLTNKRAKIIKDWNSNIWLVMIMDNIDCSFDNNYGMGIVTFNANWLEVGDPTNQEDLQATGLIDVGGV